MQGKIRSADELNEENAAYSYRVSSNISQKLTAFVLKTTEYHVQCTLTKQISICR